jgi:hypothetical protein
VHCAELYFRTRFIGFFNALAHIETDSTVRPFVFDCSNSRRLVRLRQINFHPHRRFRTSSSVIERKEKTEGADKFIDHSECKRRETGKCEGRKSHAEKRPGTVALAKRLLEPHQVKVAKITVWETPNCFASRTSDEAGPVMTS